MTGISLLGTLGRWLLFIGTLAWVGAAGVRFVLLPLWAQRPAPAEPLRGSLLREATRLGVLGSLLLAAGTLSRLQMQVADFVDPFEPPGPQVHALLTATSWGRVWIFQAVAVTIGALAFLSCRSGGGRRSWAFVGLATLSIAFAPGLSGHAIASEGYAALAVGADAAHVLAGGVWLGGLAAIGLALAASIPDWGEPYFRVALADLVDVFSPVALFCAAVIGTTGLFGAWLHVPSLSDVFGSAYGRTLLLKMAAVGAVLAAGTYNWRRVKPKLGRPEAPGRLLRSAAIECLFASVVLLVTALLVVTSPE